MDLLGYRVHRSRVYLWYGFFKDWGSGLRSIQALGFGLKV